MDKEDLASEAEIYLESENISGDTFVFVDMLNEPGAGRYLSELMRDFAINKIESRDKRMKELENHENRERKFRAWCHDPDDITEGELTHNVYPMKWPEVYIDMDVCDYDESVKMMEWVGITHNKRDVFERDVYSLNGFLYVVEWVQGHCAYRFMDLDTYGDGGSSIMITKYINDMEYIGLIYEKVEWVKKWMIKKNLK